MRLSIILVYSLLAMKSFANPVAAPKVANQTISSDAIKSCLVDVYIAQQKYFELNDTYTRSPSELRLSELKACQGIKISFDTVTAQNFILMDKPVLSSGV